MSTTPAADGSPRPRLSIAMGTYNGARFLAEQLDSFAAQTRPPDEVVVCDEKSTDATVAVLEAFRDRAPFPVRIHGNPTRLGIIRNFEKAIQHCTGDIIFLSDQDDVWYPEKLAAHEAVYRDRPEVGLVFNDLDVVTQQLQPLGYTTFGFQRVLPRRQARMARGNGFPLLVKRPLVNGCAMSFRAEYRDFLCPMPERLWLHDEWIALLVSAVAVCQPIPRSLANYRQHDGQSMGATHVAGSWEYDRMGFIDDQLIRLDAAIARLRSIEPRLRRRSYLDFIEGKRTHIRRRQAMSPSILGRLPAVARELLNGNYKRYGVWVKSELKSDLRSRLQVARLQAEAQPGRVG